LFSKRRRKTTTTYNDSIDCQESNEYSM